MQRLAREAYAAGLQTATAVIEARRSHWEALGKKPGLVYIDYEIALHAASEAESCIEAVRALESEEK